jgi:hypothetical protein
MKNILYCILSCLIILVTSCNDTDKDLFPENYHKVLYFRNDGKVRLSLNTTQNNPSDSILVLKAGSDPTLKADVKIKVLTQSELDEAYSHPEGVSYKLIPAGSYSFTNGQELTFDRNERSKVAYVTFDPTKIYSSAKNDKSSKYVLPIQLVSDNDTIFENKDKILFVIDVQSPTIYMTTNDTTTEMVYQSLDINLSAELRNSEMNDWNFTCGLDASTADEAHVNSYNLLQGTHYELLPASSYSIEPFNFTKGIKNSQSVLKINRNNLQNDHVYLLPLKLAQSSMGNQLDISDSIKYIVLKNPKYGLGEADRSTWKILLCTADNARNDVGDTSDPDGAPAILDNNPNTWWAYPHSNNWYTDYANNDDYDYNFTDYHAFKGDRDKDYNGGEQIFVIDMQKSRVIAGVGINQNLTCWAALTDAEFYVSDDPAFLFTPYQKGGDINDYNRIARNNWSYLMEFANIPTYTAETSWKILSSNDMNNGGAKKGRFLKMRILKGTAGRDAHGAFFAELRVMLVNSINGVAQ